MRYAVIRSRVMTGDLIAFRKRTGFLPTLTRWLSRKPYTHTAVAAWVEAGGVYRLLVSESNSGGSSLSPLSAYADIDFDVYRCPVNRDLVHTVMWRLLGKKIHYGFIDLARIAAHRLVGWPLPPADDGNLICSALSATIYLKAGWRPIGLPSIPAPDDVVDAIRAEPLIRYRAHD